MSKNAKGGQKNKEAAEEPNFQIRPPFSQKFKPGAVKEIIHTTMNEHLAGKLYDAQKVSAWSKAIADSVKTQVKTLGYERRSISLKMTEWYKIVVEVLIGEQRGEGVRMGSRCLWDSDTDNYASDVYMNDSLFCCTAVFGLYFY